MRNNLSDSPNAFTTLVVAIAVGNVIRRVDRQLFLACEQAMLVIDLTACRYLDSAGIREVLMLNKALAERRQQLVLVLEVTGSVHRVLSIVGAGHTAVTAREGALKVREAARVLAEGFDAEFFLHGTAVPLTAQDHVLALTTPDDDGLVEGVARAAEAEGIGVTRLPEPSRLPGVLAQIPLVARLHMLALRFATERGQDPDTVIVGHWDDPKLWSIGSPLPERPPAAAT